MEEQATWKGHGFTLFVFTGIVFLCAIFFILGMLVGRSQGQKYATNGSETKKTSPSSTKAGGDPSVFEDLQKNELPPLVVEQTPPSDKPAQDTPPDEPVAKGGDSPVQPPSPPSAPPSASVVNLQVGALGQSATASKLVAELKKLGFNKVFVVSPAPGDAKPVYRVQVGPFSDAAEADSTKQKLEAAGYSPILKK